MKKILKTLGIAIVLINTAPAQQKIFTGGQELQSAMGDNQTSKVYEMKGPYAIRWVLRDIKPKRSQDSLAEYWKPHTTEKPPWVSIKVMDATTKKLVDNTMEEAFEGQMQIPTGGKHYLVVTGESDVAWTIWAKDGRLNETGSEVKVNTADIGGGTASAAAQKIELSLMDKFQGTELDARIAAVKLVESRSSNADDFKSRWEAYCKSQGWR